MDKVAIKSDRVVIIILIVLSVANIDVLSDSLNFGEEGSAKSGIGLADKQSNKNSGGKVKIWNFQFYDPIDSLLQAKRFAQKLRKIEQSKKRSKKAVILITIDSIGGEKGCVDQIVNAIKSTVLPVYGFIDNGRCGGVYGWACAIPLACSKVYIHKKAKLGTHCPLKKIPDKAPGGRHFCTPIHPALQSVFLKGIDILSFVSLINTLRAGQTSDRPTSKGWILTAHDACSRRIVDKVVNSRIEVIDDITQNKPYKKFDIPVMSANFVEIKKYLSANEKIDKYKSMALRIVSKDTRDIRKRLKDLKKQLAAIKVVKKACIDIKCILRCNPNTCRYVESPASSRIRMILTSDANLIVKKAQELFDKLTVREKEVRAEILRLRKLQFKKSVEKLRRTFSR